MRSFFIYIYTHIRSNLYTRRSAIVVTPTRTRRNNTSGTTLVINVCQPRPNRYRETIEIAATLAPIFFPSLSLSLSPFFFFFPLFCQRWVNYGDIRGASWPLIYGWGGGGRRRFQSKSRVRSTGAREDEPLVDFSTRVGTRAFENGRGKVPHRYEQAMNIRIVAR